MMLSKIVLHNFRNFGQKEFRFSPLLTIIFGENALGKTNLLEAVYCLTYGVGFRESKEEELLMIGETRAKIIGFFIDDKAKIEFQISFSKNKALLVKKYFINKASKRLSVYQNEVVKSILFSPQQLEIVTGSPEGRRQYFDKLIGFYDLEYKKKLTNYENALRKRNRILEHYHDKAKLKEELFFWDGYLEEQAKYLTEKRKQYLNFLNENQKIDDKKFSIQYFQNEFSHQRLKEFFAQERKYRRTLIGPQKDDFQISVSNNKNFTKNLHHFGSRSEHRLGIFWLKLNEIRYYERIFKRKPILLLDDIFSELDINNKKLILNLIKNYQTILTTAEPEVVGLSDFSKTVIKI